MDQDDAAIVARVQAGDVEAFALLVDRHHARALRLAVHLLGDPDEAEDAVQEAFVRAYRHLGGYRERERFGAWLARIVVNQCRTHAARARRRAGADLHDPALALGDALAVPAACEAAERRAALAHALAQLAPEQREAVVLRYADDLTYDEMAALTGVGVSALKMRVQRACGRLRALLSEVLHG